MNEQILQGHWNELKGEIQRRWAQLTDDDLTKFDGDVNQLVGLIQQRTGEVREVIESFLENVASDTAGCAERAKQGVDQAAKKLREEQERIAAGVKQGYEQAEQAVRRKPVESLAIAFGVGIVSGLVIGLTLRNRS